MQGLKSLTVDRNNQTMRAYVSYKETRESLVARPSISYAATGRKSTSTANGVVGLVERTVLVKREIILSAEDGFALYKSVEHRITREPIDWQNGLIEFIIDPE
jgi:hypothetical protein